MRCVLLYVFWVLFAHAAQVTAVDTKEAMAMPGVVDFVSVNVASLAGAS